MPLWVWGLAGGAAVELLRWYRIREQLHLGAPDWAKSPLYWLVTMRGAGGRRQVDAARRSDRADAALVASRNTYGWSVARSWARSPPRMLVML